MTDPVPSPRGDAWRRILRHFGKRSAVIRALAAACATSLVAGACQAGGGDIAAPAQAARSPRPAVGAARSAAPSPAPGSSSAAPGPQQGGAGTVVSLSFDDQWEDQWLYGEPLFAAHNMTATYYVITSDTDAGYATYMSWFQLATLQAQGNDVGSHTITHPDLTQENRNQMAREICGSRQDMISHGIADPQSFAYPFGNYNPAVESVVRQCGFNNARSAGGISQSDYAPSAPYSETIPPQDPYALKAIAPDGSTPIRLSALESFVTAAAANGGGWVPFNFHDVCDAGAADFSHCMSTYGPVQDTVLGEFLDWLAASGKPGGAPAGVVVKNVCQVMNCP